MTLNVVQQLELATSICSQRGQLDAIMRAVRVSERLTAEAVACRLAAYPPADPLFYVPSSEDGDHAASHLPFLPSQRELKTAGYGAKLRTHVLSPDLVSAIGPSEPERAKEVIVQAVLAAKCLQWSKM